MGQVYIFPGASWGLWYICSQEEPGGGGGSQEEPGGARRSQEELYIYIYRHSKYGGIAFNKCPNPLI